ncbi:Molybdopterin molybdochelatase [Carbonactinospora thermoautotrophica]|nr:gephyrin-like molybdotransferase Glp [Carbonactinospora thermoautotrophica]KWW99007.1 Molybdopterin molybdochelatase [Carbonactinospora thermoautotrophica]
MKSVDNHLAEVLADIEPLAPMDLQLLDAHGCLLTEDVAADRDLPAFDNSAMDGYAVRLPDVTGASEEFPALLPVVGDIMAGSAQIERINPGTCVRIMTGAPVPAGADAIVPVEWTDGGITQVRIHRAPAEGQFIRRRGTHIRAGEVVLRAGTWLGATQIGVLAAIGRDRVKVRPKPRVVVVSTGSELVELGREAGPGQIHDSNSFMLAAAAVEAGAVAYRVGIVPDDAEQLLSTLEDQLGRADLVITSGGVSQGAYDTVKETLSRLGTVGFDRVAMNPGMPQGFGTIGTEAVPIFTLPGNPVSAYVSFEVFVRPAIRRMLGVEPLHRPVVQARCLQAFSSPEGKRQYVRGWYDAEAETVRPVGGHASHLIGDLAQANAFIVVPEEVTEVKRDDVVDVMLLERT